jgi:hypothetical protein
MSLRTKHHNMDEISEVQPRDYLPPKASNTRTVLLDPTAMYRPFGLKATAFAAS